MAAPCRAVTLLGPVVVVVALCLASSLGTRQDPHPKGIDIEQSGPRAPREVVVDDEEGHSAAALAAGRSSEAPLLTDSRVGPHALVEEERGGLVVSGEHERIVNAVKRFRELLQKAQTVTQKEGDRLTAEDVPKLREEFVKKLLSISFVRRQWMGIVSDRRSAEAELEDLADFDLEGLVDAVDDAEADAEQQTMTRNALNTAVVKAEQAFRQLTRSHSGAWKAGDLREVCSAAEESAKEAQALMEEIAKALMEEIAEAEGLMEAKAGRRGVESSPRVSEAVRKDLTETDAALRSLVHVCEREAMEASFEDLKSSWDRYKTWGDDFDAGAAWSFHTGKAMPLFEPGPLDPVVEAADEYLRVVKQYQAELAKVSGQP